ncbi:hypothetical protein ACFFRS_27325, partial [Saccharopolyspora hordei]
MRFDLRAEFAALTGEPHPFAFWQRVEQLPDRFEHEQRRQLQAARPAPDRPKPPAAGVSALSGDLGAPAEPELSGSLDVDVPEPPRPSGMSGSLAAEGQLAGSLPLEPPPGPPSGPFVQPGPVDAPPPGAPPQPGPVDGPRPEPGVLGGPPPRRDGPPSGPPPAPPRPDEPRFDRGLIDSPPPRREGPDGPLGPPSGPLGQLGPEPGEPTPLDAPPRPEGVEVGPPS